MLKPSCLSSAWGRKVASMSPRASARSTGWTAMSMRPASILDRSRMSSMRVSRSVPALWMVRANSICRSVRLASAFSDRSRASSSSEFSGVRSSWETLARNSDLYLEAWASCSAFSSMSWRAASTSRFLTSMALFCADRSVAFSSSSTLVSWRRSDWARSSWAMRWDSRSSTSVRALPSMVARVTPTLGASESRNFLWSPE